MKTFTIDDEQLKIAWIEKNAPQQWVVFISDPITAYPDNWRWWHQNFQYPEDGWSGRLFGIALFDTEQEAITFTNSVPDGSYYAECWHKERCIHENT